MKHMLTKNPASRFSVNDILKHDWVTANGIQPLVIKNYLPVTIEPEDKEKAIGKINAMQLIRVRMK
jgi:serine/threonine protein kinase